MTFSIGDRLILRDLPRSKHSVRDCLPLSIGMVVSVDPLRAKLRLGNQGSGVHWAPKSRAITEANVVRIATPRECETGFVNRESATAQKAE